MWGPRTERQSDGIVTATSTVRVINERAVFEALRLLGRASATDLVVATGLSKPTIAVAVADLERVGLIDQLGRRTGHTGRAPRLYRLSPRAGAVLAFDVGRAWVRAAIADLTGAVVVRDEERSRPRSGSALARQVVELADRLLTDSGLAREQVTHTVVGSPGVYDEATDVLRLTPNLPGWGRPGIVARLREGLPGTLLIENDINLAALAESAQWAERGLAVPDFVFLSAGSGLGMAVVLGGRLLRGAHGGAGEVSYLPTGRWDNRRGNRVSIEQLTGPTEIVKQAQRLGLSAVRRPEDVFDLARKGSRAAQRAVRTEAQRLAGVIAGVVAVLDPPLVVLGGGIGRNGDLLLDPIADALSDLVPLQVPELRVSELSTDAPLIGAMAAGLERARNLAFESALQVAPH